MDMRICRQKIAIIGLSFLLTISAAAAYEAPRFLSYSDMPVKSDAIVLFIGSEEVARKKEALKLLNDGYGRFLIIPAYQEVISHEKITVAAHDVAGNGVWRGKAYPRFYEKTNVEALYAKAMMDAIGLRTALLVSSPYHMRRIRIIAEKVFGEQARCFSYVPTPYGNEPVSLRYLDRADWMSVIEEYVKICWFSIYASFVNQDNRSWETINDK